jgi:hypothetical protein
MAEDFSTIRTRIHNKSHNYFFFELGRWDRASRGMFYGATDALLDATQAAASYPNVVSSDTAVNLLACYGFLQALYIQQDAVGILSRSVGLSWKPEDENRLKEIREIRNRLTGHPALAGDRRRMSSSAIIPYGDIDEHGFSGHIYYQDRFEIVRVGVKAFQKENEELLAKQMLLVEEVMDKSERQFRAERSATPLSSFFEGGFRYLMDRLHCDLNDKGRVIQAQSHSQMVRQRIIELEKELADRRLDSNVMPMHVVFTGLKLLEEIMESGDATLAAQDKFDLIYSGLERKIFSLIAGIKDIDEKLLQPVT